MQVFPSVALASIVAWNMHLEVEVVVGRDARFALAPSTRELLHSDVVELYPLLKHAVGRESGLCAVVKLATPKH